MTLLANYVTITKDEQMECQHLQNIFEGCLYFFLFSYFCRSIWVAGVCGYQSVPVCSNNVRVLLAMLAFLPQICSENICLH